MSEASPRRRPRAVVPALVGLCGAVALAALPGQVRAEAPTPGPGGPAADCAAPFPVAGLAQGARVHGLTVTRGTTPEEFTGAVVGVLENGIAPGVDMVVADLESPELSRVGGIWQGMSGSPVYAQDGRLIGAVAYGLSYGASPVAGITPYEQMDDYLAGGSARVHVDDSTARDVARRTGVAVRQLAGGFEPLPMPLGFTGVSPRRLDQAARSDRDYRPDRGSYVVGRSGVAAAGPGTLVAGGNLAAAVSHGDVTSAGVGTVTSVCDGRMVGFGHPMTYSGRTTLTLHPAEALYVQPDSLGSPFKVANLGDPVGTITDDRLTGISGHLDGLPTSTRISSEVSLGARSRTGTTHVSLPEATAETTLLQHLANHDRVVDGAEPGSTELSYVIRGTQGDGRPFEISATDRFRSAGDITFESAFETADVVWGLSQVDGVTLTDVDMVSRVSAASGSYRLARLEQRRRGAWEPIGRGAPAVVRAGRSLTIRAVLSSGAATRHVVTTFKVPKAFRGTSARLSLVGGSSTYSDAAYRSTVAGIARALAAQVRNDAVEATLSLGDERRRAERRSVSAPVDLVVTGQKRARVRVR